MQLSPGTRLGPYEIVGPIGAGYFEWEEPTGDLWVADLVEP